MANAEALVGYANDKYVRVDPSLGLGYWGGIAYGFALTGILIQIDLMTGAGTPISILNEPANLAFYGAGTTTVAPITVA